MRRRPFLPKFQRFAVAAAGGAGGTDRLAQQARALAGGHGESATAATAAAAASKHEMKRGTIRFTLTGVPLRVRKFAAAEILDFVGYAGVYTDDGMKISEGCFKAISGTPVAGLNAVLARNVDVGPAISDEDSEAEAEASSMDDPFQIEYHDRYSVSVRGMAISGDGSELVIDLQRVPSILTTNSEARELQIAFPPVAAAVAAAAASRQVPQTAAAEAAPAPAAPATKLDMAPRALDTVQKSDKLPWVVVSECQNLREAMSFELKTPLAMTDVPVCLNRVMTIRHQESKTGEDVSVSDQGVHTGLRKAGLGVDMNVTAHANPTASKIDVVVHNLSKFMAMAKHIGVILRNK